LAVVQELGKSLRSQALSLIKQSGSRNAGNAAPWRSGLIAWHGLIAVAGVGCKSG
jgi:hypothetical protein